MKNEKVVIRIIKNKRAISVMVGYVLLISFAIIMSGVVYTWLKSYTPTDSFDCPDEISLYIKELKCISEPNSDKLNLTLENNGKFNIGGYYIRAAEITHPELTTLDLSEYLLDESFNNVIKLHPGIKFLGEENPLKPNEEIKNVFELVDEISLIEIIPFRYQEYDNKKRLVICGNAQIVQEISCGPTA